MKNKNQLRLKFTLILGEKEKIKTKKIFYGSLFFIFFSVLGSLAVWFFKISWGKIAGRLKIYRQLLTPKLSFQLTFSKGLFLLLALNLGIWGWLNQEDVVLIYKPLIETIKEVSFPVALGKTEDGIILGAEDAVKIDDLHKKSTAENYLQEVLGEEKKLSLSLAWERCQRNKLEGKSSELCGKYEKDETLEKELAKLDYLEKLKKENSVKKIKRMAGPIPYVFDTDNLGRRVCNKSNDKPSKSDKGKGKHMDMECCLDPDEYPNPHCYYSPEKYGKYL